MQQQRMRQPRRYRWLKLSIFVIVYSVFHAVVSAPPEPDKNSVTDAPGHEPTKPPDMPKSELEDNGVKLNTDKKHEDELDIGKDLEGTKEKETKASDSNEKNKGKLNEGEGKEGKDGKEEEVKDGKKIGNTEEDKTNEGELSEPTSTVATVEYVHPTYRPKRNCTPPAIEQFPRPLMGPTARRYGGLVIHVLVAIFTFVGLAIICDDYFVSSLDRICEELKMAPDVAGATFMAAGSSAPELATVVIGVFWAQDDIGVSGVIGSAVFNIMFVISVCALCAGTVSYLNWWPLVRDCFFYAVSILVMLCTIWDGVVFWWEAVIMLVFYVVYCVALHFNSSLERLVLRHPMPFKLPTREEQAALVTYKSAGDKPPADAQQYAHVEGSTQETRLQSTGYSADGTYENVAYNAEPPSYTQEWDPNRSGWGEEPQTQAPAWDAAAAWNEDAPAPAPPAAPVRRDSSPLAAPEKQVNVQPGDQSQNYYRPKEHGTGVNPLEKPPNPNLWQLVCFYVAYPVHWSARKTMPDCRGRWYPVTFCISMLWISFYSYFMVWMITIIGTTLNVPDTVMGLTFVAAGVSVPDALSSLAVIKEGYGDMAVSNAVGSNVFDILVCLGLPWLIQTSIIKPGSVVHVISKGLVYSTLSLFSTVVFLVLATHLNGWKLDRKYGIILMVWYLLFITFASLYELNVFGNFHPPDCHSEY